MSVDFTLGAAQSAWETRLQRFEAERFLERLWAHDPTLWSPDSAHQQVARTRLGWLDAPRRMSTEVRSLQDFAGQVAGEGFTDAVLLGMGGSSLAPEVFSLSFGVGPKSLRLTVLDSTSPAGLRTVSSTHDPGRTLFLVSSKSGTTVEVSCFERYFYEWVRAVLGSRAGQSFVAITDPATPLESLARSRGYRRVFTNDPNIGGRYSALSFFGLVPAALIGVDLAALLDHAADEARRSGPGAAADGSIGLKLGAALGELALRGRDKLTLVLGSEINSLGSWIEQLIAESTGKDGKGIIPIAGEVLGSPAVYGDDRVFVALSVAPLPVETETALLALARAGHPVLRWRLPELTAMGAEFLRWEVATATAAAVIGVDPFDEPNVTEAKQATRAMLDRFVSAGSFPDNEALSTSADVHVEAPRAVAESIAPPGGGRDDPAAWAAAFTSLARPGDYFAVLAYLQRTEKRDAMFGSLRRSVRNATQVATTVGYGPRFLHSTGQLHKGGPNTGIFLQLTADEGEDVTIPGEPFGFAALIRAQATGDYQVLERRGRRVMRIHLGAEPDRALEAIVEAIQSARV